MPFDFIILFEGKAKTEKNFHLINSSGFRGSNSGPCLWCYLVLDCQHHAC